MMDGGCTFTTLLVQGPVTNLGPDIPPVLLLMQEKYAILTLAHDCFLRPVELLLS